MMTKRLTIAVSVVAMLVGGLLVTPVTAQPGPDPLSTILTKLDQLLTALDNSSADLQGVTQNWDKALPSASRFTVLAAFNNEAVRDDNTGLVWERVQDARYILWSESISYCANKTVGGTVGWRLPSVVELNSVRDPSLPAPFVPASIFTVYVG